MPDDKYLKNYCEAIDDLVLSLLTDKEPTHGAHLQLEFIDDHGTFVVNQRKDGEPYIVNKFKESKDARN